MPGKRLRVTSDLRKSIEDVAKDLNQSQINKSYSAKRLNENRYLDDDSTLEELANYVTTLTKDLTEVGFIKK